jgi:hypothetical protein
LLVEVANYYFQRVFNNILFDTNLSA